MPFIHRSADNKHILVTREATRPKVVLGMKNWLGYAVLNKKALDNLESVLGSIGMKVEKAKRMHKYGLEGAVVYALSNSNQPEKVKTIAPGEWIGDPINETSLGAAFHSIVGLEFSRDVKPEEKEEAKEEAKEEGKEEGKEASLQSISNVIRNLVKGLK